MSVSVAERRPTRKARVWLRQASGENVAYDPETGSVHMLNATAVAIWVLCDGHTRVAEMIDAICELSGLPAEVVSEDVDRILREFYVAGILNWEE
jgi:Coenzyme PQQ synthesis protein D (PqqD)